MTKKDDTLGGKSEILSSIQARCFHTWWWLTLFPEVAVEGEEPGWGTEERMKSSFSFCS